MLSHKANVSRNFIKWTVTNLSITAMSHFFPNVLLVSSPFCVSSAPENTQFNLFMVKVPSLCTHIRQLFELFKTYELHAHSNTCWKYNKSECRFCMADTLLRRQ